jgi:hypothetical protein
MRIAAFFVVLGLALAPVGQAGTFSVTTLGDSGPGSLRQAILDANAASGADTIRFSSSLTGTIPLATPLPTITDAAGLAIEGPGASALTISGGHAVQVLSVASGASLSLRGVTVADGGSSGLAAGGGAANAGTLSVADSTFSGNRAGCQAASFGVYGGGGGAIFSSGTLSVTGSVFAGNAAGCGSGIANSGTATVTDSTFSGNGDATNPDTVFGGGVLNTGTLTLTGSTLSGNGASSWGAGIVNSGSVTVDRSTISGNHTGVEGGSGILNHTGGDLVVTDSTISGNGSDLEGDGGGIANFGTASVAGSTLSGNRTGGSASGGGIYNGGTLTVTNSTLAANHADVGGGAICNAATATVSSTTISGNDANGAPAGLGGGGIRSGCGFGQAATGPTSISSTILAGNANGNCSGAIADGGYNISSDAGCAFSASTSLASTDPMLGPLADNGGPTQTMALLAGSPAVNKIPAGVNGCGTTLARDQRGVARPVGPGCDVGAYEDESLAVQLAYLRTAVAGIGPGSSLADKIKQIQAGGAGGACGRLGALGAEVRAQTGKKLSPAQAAALVVGLQTVAAMPGC